MFSQRIFAAANTAAPESVYLWWFVASRNLAGYPPFEPDSQIGASAIGIVSFPEEPVQSRDQAISLQYSNGYNGIVMLDICRMAIIHKENLSDEAAFDIAETQQLLAYITSYDRQFPNSPFLFDARCFVGKVCFDAHRHEQAKQWLLRADELYRADKKMNVNEHYSKTIITIRKWLAEIDKHTNPSPHPSDTPDTIPR